ncbi:hypothetical protein C7B76_16660 [filamentous cyanobacterium CCP2]|nr:hypothetical protein C7B76_16660 [filamentous cyanobacterium CCP2]
MKKTKLVSKIGWHWLVGITLGMSFIAKPVASADVIDPNADEVLQFMSAYLAETEAFSVNADIDFEVVATDGQKLQLSSFATAIVQRPDKFRIQRQGVVADAEFIFDGETLTLYGNRNNVYTQLEVPGTVDDAIRAFELETGIPVPGADLLFTDPYPILSTGVSSSTYVGTAYVNGIECHHLAFREDEVDWQLWVQTGDTPLPMKYVVTSKWVTAAPQYEIRLRDWNTNPLINEEQFAFSAPEGATPLEVLPANVLEEFTSTGEAQ